MIVININILLEKLVYQFYNKFKLIYKSEK